MPHALRWPIVSSSESPSRRRRFLKLALVGLVAGVAVAGLVGNRRYAARRDRVYAVTAAGPAIPNDEATVSRGRHLATTLGGCAECHGADFGGKLMGDDPPIRVVAPNLTRGAGSATAGYTDADWYRAIVHGVNRQQRSLLVMPSKDLGSLAETDIAAIIAFLKTAPPVDRSLPRAETKALGTVLFGLTNAPVLSAEEVDHAAPGVPKAPPPFGVTRVYGEYLTNVCRGCHGATLRGGIVPHPGSPPSADISPAAMKGWDYGAFERALREGKKRDGSNLDPNMPWQGVTKNLTPEEMRALWLGLRQEDS